MEPLVAIELSRPSSFDPHHAARKGAPRRLRPLRLLPARLPDLRPLGRRDGLAPRPHLHDGQSRPGRSPARPELPHPHGPVPRLHGLHDRLPLRRPVQQAHRRHPRAGRTQHPPHHRGLALPQTPLRHLPASDAPGLMAAPLFLYQRSGLQSLVRSLRPAQTPPQTLRRDGITAPHRPAHFNWNMPSTGRIARNARRRVGMLTGCVQQVFFSHVNAATARVLAAEGCEVITPANQPCCGALMVHSGLEEQAAAMARNIIALFEAANVDTIVINAAGCGSTMKEYGHLLRDDPQWAARAAPSPQSAKTSRRSSASSHRSPRAIRCPCASRITTLATCVTRRASSSSRATCSQNSTARSRRDRRTLALLRLRGRLQPAPAGARAAAWRPQSRPPARHALAGGRLRQSRLPPAAHERPPPSRRKAMPAFHMVELLDASIRGLSPQELLRPD